MAGVVKCWTGGPGVQVDPTDNVVSLGDRYGPVIRLGSRRVLTDEQCVDLREQILSTVKAVGDGADLLVNKYQDERKFARIGLASLKGVLKEDKWQMIATDLVEPYFRGCFFFLASVSGFVVPPGADAQVTHTDHWFARYARGVVRGVRVKIRLARRHSVGLVHGRLRLRGVAIPSLPHVEVGVYYEATQKEDLAAVPQRVCAAVGGDVVSASGSDLGGQHVVSI